MTRQYAAIAVATFLLKAILLQGSKIDRLLAFLSLSLSLPLSLALSLSFSLAFLALRQPKFAFCFIRIIIIL